MKIQVEGKKEKDENLRSVLVYNILSLTDDLRRIAQLHLEAF